MRPIAILLLLGICFSAFSQDNSQYYYNARVAKFQKMKIGGIVLLSTGVLATAGGIAMIASAGTASYQVTYNSDGTQTESGDPVGGFGAVITMFGIPMTVGGIVLTAIGAKKEREAKNERQGGIPIELKIGANRVALTYSF